MGRSKRHAKREPEERNYKVYVDGRWVFISAYNHRIHKDKDEPKTQQRHKSRLVFA